MKTKFLMKMVYSLLCLSTLGVGGCVQVYDFPLEAHTQYAQVGANVIELPVILVISDELKRSEVYTKQVGGGEKIVLGKLLEANSIELTEALFSSVVVKGSKEGAKNSDGAVILTPKLVSSFRDLRKEQTATAVIEWELTDDEGRLIWVTTVEGKGTAKARKTLRPFKEPEDRARKQTTLLMQDLFDKSYLAIQGSPEIRAYAERIGR